MSGPRFEPDSERVTDALADRDTVFGAVFMSSATSFHVILAAKMK